MSGQSAFLSLKEAKAMQERVSCGNTQDNASSHKSSSKSSYSEVHEKKMPEHEKEES